MAGPMRHAGGGLHCDDIYDRLARAEIESSSGPTIRSWLRHPRLRDIGWILFRRDFVWLIVMVLVMQWRRSCRDTAHADTSAAPSSSSGLPTSPCRTSLVNWPWSLPAPPRAGSLVSPILPLLSVPGLDVAIAIGILRHRLYDIDLVISKTLVYGSLAVLIGAVYVAVVVGLGTLIGTNGKPNTALGHPRHHGGGGGLPTGQGATAEVRQPSRLRVPAHTSRGRHRAGRLDECRRPRPGGASRWRPSSPRQPGLERAEVWLASASALVGLQPRSGATPGPAPSPPVPISAAAFPTASARAPIIDQEETLGVNRDLQGGRRCPHPHRRRSTRQPGPPGSSRPAQPGSDRIPRRPGG